MNLKANNLYNIGIMPFRMKGNLSLMPKVNETWQFLLAKSKPREIMKTYKCHFMNF